MVQILGITKKVIRVGKISDKHDIIKVEEKIIPVFGNNTKRIFKGMHEKYE